MLRRAIMALLVVGVSAVVSGCGGPKGSDFEGHWERTSAKAPASLDIKYEDGVYHIDRTAKSMLDGKMETKRLEGTALSDTVLSVNVGLGVLNLRLEKGQILVNNEVYIKSAH